MITLLTRVEHHRQLLHPSLLIDVYQIAIAYTVRSETFTYNIVKNCSYNRITLYKIVD